MAKPQLEDGYIRLANEIVDAFARLHLSGNEWRVLWVILRKTYGYNKKVDNIANSQICKDTGLGKTVVSRALKKLQMTGVISRNSTTVGLKKDYEGWLHEFPQPPEPPEPKYKRRIKTGDGYVAIWYRTVEPQFHSMTNQTGYIYEHRLIMARKLGRPLEPWEIVHHIDGVRDRNVEDNLVLLPGRPEHMPSIQAKREITKQKEVITLLLKAIGGEDKLAELLIIPNNLSKQEVKRLSTLAKTANKVSSPVVAQKTKDNNKTFSKEKVVNPRIKDILDIISEKTGQQIPFYAKEGTAVKRALSMSFTPAEIIGCWEKMKGFEFWQGKWLPLAKVTENLGEYKSGRLSDGKTKRRRVDGSHTSTDLKRGW